MPSEELKLTLRQFNKLAEQDLMGTPHMLVRLLMETEKIHRRLEDIEDAIRHK